VALDDPSLKENLSFLRSTAVALEGKGFGTKLIIPDSQILYLEMTAPGPSETDQRDQIEAALDGQTPYDVSDLVFDWRGAGPEVLVAVIARETLDEAEEFAVEHRFNPISFVGESVHDGVKWSPFFGRSDFSYAFLGADVDVRDDPVAVRKRPGADEENLFQPPVAPAKAPIAPEPATETTNIFADSPDGAETNLFEADDEEAYIKKTEEQVQTMFAEIPKTLHQYLVKKTVRKILRILNKQIKYSGNKQTEAELLLHFCRLLKGIYYRYNEYVVLLNMYEAQMNRARTAIKSLHEDLQYDLGLLVKEVNDLQ